MKIERALAGLTERLGLKVLSVGALFGRRYCLVEAMMVITTASVSLYVLFIALLG